MLISEVENRPHAGRQYALREGISYERWKRGLLFFRYAVGRKSGRVRIGKASSSAAVAQPSQRLVAFDDPPLDGVLIGTVVHEVPRLVRHPLGGLGSGVPAQ